MSDFLFQQEVQRSQQLIAQLQAQLTPEQLKAPPSPELLALLQQQQQATQQAFLEAQQNRQRITQAAIQIDRLNTQRQIGDMWFRNMEAQRQSAEENRLRRMEASSRHTQELCRILRGDTNPTVTLSWR